ncbi:MAG: sigma 54-interacting transcriptional regulator [Desulfovibrionaceae bacterium]|nr:sigma 54-interacting transcriptional regulator [Desulfovibrionaceae bacterium]
MNCRSPYFLHRHFERILDALPDGLFITDTSGTTLRVNRMYEQLTGLKQEEVQGKNVRALVEEGVFDQVLNPGIVRTGKPATHVQKLQNGKKLVLSGFPVFDENGELCLVVTFVRDITLLTQMNEQMAEQRQLIDQINDQLAYMTHEQAKLPEPVYAGPAMGEVVSLLQRFAVTDATVLILGETGVGKDVFARLTHGLSARRDKILLKVDCGGISETLTESEIFGYMPGAFTGASNKGKAGYFEIADGGTIFLDEVGELPLSMQTRLLRVLQDGEIMRVGGSSPRKVDVRVIAATNRNLAENVEAGTFRRDLYYRLNVATVQIPPLRERAEDVRPLAEHFLRQYATKYRKSMAFMDVTLDMMSRYAWPGNVRELQNMVHSLVITLKGPMISPRDLPVQISGVNPGDSCYTDEILSVRRPLKDIMAEVERDFLLKAIEVHGSVQKVAELFRINRSTVFRKIQGTRRTSD